MRQRVREIGYCALRFFYGVVKVYGDSGKNRRGFVGMVTIAAVCCSDESLRDLD